MTDGSSADASANNAAIYVKLVDITRRNLSQQDLMQQTRALNSAYARMVKKLVRAADLA